MVLARDARHRFSLLKACAGVACVLLALGAAAKPVVTYPRPESLDDARASYPIALLRLSLYKAGDAYQLEASPVRTQQGRSLLLLEQGKGIDLVWTVTSQAREQALLPVRIPIDRGLIGWRLLLIRPQDRALLAPVKSVTALAPLRAGQGHDWPDTEVLRANGLTVHTSSSYARLFKMLQLGHIQYFPRAVTEIWDELDAQGERSLAVADGIVLHYPEALYYFVNKSNTALAAAIEKGLRIAIADGSMDALFQRHFGPAIARAALERRTVLTLHNPLLPAATPLAEPALWFRFTPPR
jgi:hypothetical protein